MRTRSLLLLALASCVGIPSATAAVNWQVHCGLGGKDRYGGTTLVRVELQNTTPTFTGELTGVDGANRYVVPIHLPENSHKTYTLHLPSEIETLYLTGPGSDSSQPLADADHVGDDQDLLVVIGGESGYLQFLNERGVSGGARGLAVAQIGWHELPESWLGWDGVDVVALGDADLSAATATGLQTLTRWVQSGGRLIVPGGATGATLATHGSLRPLLPRQVSGTRAVAGGLAPLTPWLGSAAPPGPVLLADGPLVNEAHAWNPPAAGLVSQTSCGSGTVVMTAFDPAAQPVKYWNGQRELWLALARNSGSRPDMSAARLMGDSDTLVRRFAEISLPKPWFAVIYLGIYLLALAPGQYMLLRRLDRRELAWVLTPALILIFASGGLVLGLGPRQRQPVLQRLCVLVAPPGNPIGVGHLSVGLYSPRTRAYAVQFSEHVAALNVATGEGHNPYLPHPDEDSESPRPRIVCDVPPRLEQLRLKTGTITSVAGRLMVPLGDGLTVHYAYWDGSHVRAKVTNGTPFAFNKLALLAGGEVRTTAGLRPGETRELVFGPEVSGSLSRGGMKAGPGPGPSHYGHGDYPGHEGRLPLDRQDRALLSDISQHVSSALVAITTQPMVKAELSVRAMTHDLGALCVPVQVTMHSVGTVPSWLITWQCSPSGPKSNRRYVCEVQVPVPTGWRATRIRLGYAGPNAGSWSTLQAFDAVGGQWRQQAVKPALPRLLSPPEGYMDANGVIRLKAARPISLAYDPRLGPPGGAPGPPPGPSGPGGPPGGRSDNPLYVDLEVGVAPAGGGAK